MTVKHQCPNPDCLASYSVDPAYLGRATSCKKCGRAFKLGDPKDNRPAAARNGPPPAPKELIPGMRFGGRYDVRRILGRGGMGAVYLAHDTQLRRDVALKIPLIEADHEAYTEVVRRFMHEGRAAAGLDHPNICPVHDVGQVDGQYYLTMAYIEGKPLSSLLAKGPLPETQAAEVVLTLARALSEAHQHGVVHRDLKPSNIQVSPRRGLVIMDFGLARGLGADESRITQAGQLLGTPAYMAPEQVQGNVAAIGPGCDIYSLGVILYELLTGRVPFTGTLVELLAKVLTQPPDPPSRHRPGLDRRLEAICLKAMAKEPGRRYASMAAFATALEGYLSPGNRSGDAGNPQQQSVASPMRPIDWAVVAMGLLLLVATVFVVSRLFLPATETTEAAQREASSKAPSPVARSPELPAATPPSPTTASTEPPAPAVEADKVATRPPPIPTPPARLTNSLGMTLVPIEPGSVTIGSTDAQLALLKQQFPTIDIEKFKDEQPAHVVRITRPFYLGAHEVTVGQFRRFVEQAGYKTEGEKDGKGGYGWDEAKGEWVQDPKYTWRNPGFPQGDEHPVVLVNWNDAHAFIEWLNTTDKASLRYRLPTEAEWEYACRAGTTTLYPNGDDPEKLALIGNIGDASLKRKYPSWKWVTIQADDGHEFTAPVGTYASSPWGLYDMIGNVWEWCEDGYGSEYYKKSPAVDPPGDSGAASRVIRGGGWDSGPSGCRPASRSWIAPENRITGLGFRLAAVRSE
jgi:formylglycine-generating enzyme